jgi:hypothetical protein
MPIICHSGRLKPQSREEARMRKVIYYVLIAGFVFVDWLKFHDILKPEIPTFADWLTGGLSLLVFYVAAESLVGGLAIRPGQPQ